jgi:isoquinoline 1-oxidoreductase subunit beta
MAEIAPISSPTRSSMLHRNRTWAYDFRKSMEVWPAAGGGMLIDMIAPMLSGSSPIRRTVKNLFLRIDARGLATAVVPYVRLEPGVLRCAADAIATELGISATKIDIDNRPASTTSALSRTSDLWPTCESAFTLIAAVARTLLVTAAAEDWNIAVSDCVVEKGVVHGRRAQQTASFADLSGHAALLAIPGVVILASGRRVALRMTSMTSPSDRRPQASPAIQRSELRRMGP